MGLIFVPIFLLLLCFVPPGIFLARKAIAAAASNKKAELRCLFILIAAISATEIVAPFLIARASGASVAAWGFLFFICLSAFLPAISIGIAYGIAFKVKANPRYGIVGAAIYLSAGLMPFSWFSLADYLQTAFGLKLLY